MRSHSRAHASYWTDTLTYVTRDEVENKETRCLFSLASRLLISSIALSMFTILVKISRSTVALLWVVCRFALILQVTLSWYRVESNRILGYFPITAVFTMDLPGLARSKAFGICKCSLTRAHAPYLLRTRTYVTRDGFGEQRNHIPLWLPRHSSSGLLGLRVHYIHVVLFCTHRPCGSQSLCSFSSASP